MTTERDEGTEAPVAAVLRGDPGAADRLRAFLSGHALDPTPLRQRAEAELAATRDELEGYRLELYDTLTTDRYGKSVLAYRFFHRGRLLFAGADFHGSPLHAVDADATVAGLLAFLSLKPGDTDPEYFEDYTPEQLAFARAEGENLSLYVEELERR
jgi:hypothetical protein